MNSTKTAGHPYRREQSFDAPLRDGRTLHECIPDPNVPSPEDQDAEAQNTSDDNDDIIGMREAVLQSSIGIDPDPKLVPLHLSRVFSASITGGQTRGLLWSLYENVGDDANWRSEALEYIFGLKDGRQVPFLELLAPARQFWSGKAAQQNAWTLLNRAQSQLRANLLTALAATDDDLFLTYLFRFARTDAWRKGTVDRLSAVRDQLKQHAPAQLHALSGLTLPTLRRAITVLGTFQRKAKGKERIPAVRQRA